MIYFQVASHKECDPPPCGTEETMMMDWLAKALSLPSSFLSTSTNGGGGVIYGNASEVITTVLVATHVRYLRMQ